VARGKGGEFYEKRRKRRVYFCTLASEIDVGELKDHILDSNCAWQTRQLGDALILSKPISPSSNSDNYYIPRRAHATAASTGNIEVMLSERERSYISNKKSSGDYSRSHGLNHRSRGNSSRDKRHSRNHDNDRSQDVSDPRHKEVVVFEFGAIVLWGFSVGEESVILQTIKDFAADGQCLMASEFTASEDDMAFITHSPTSSVLELGLGLNLGGSETPGTTQDHTLDDDEEAERRPPPPEEEIDLKGTIIANDVISFPERTTCEHRLAVSYAIAQSSIVAIFEERIMQKVAEYKFIPETLASVGKIDLSTKRIGMMIGEIFVIRHDLNLHSDILDTPDFFWGEQDRLVVVEYSSIRCIFYIEHVCVSIVITAHVAAGSCIHQVCGRLRACDALLGDVLNTRLNMLKDLLDVLNQQMENDHSTKLEWIIIWLIVIEVVIQLTSVGVTIMSDLSMIA
jgi:uncharacterized Rmd1/YagE family protein